MAYIKHPWHKFQVWLNRQNPRAIAGVRGSTYQNVISRYLAEKLGKERCAVTYKHILHPRTSSPIFPALPEWAGRLVCRLNDHEDVGTGTYQYRTVKKALDEIKQEYKEDA